MTFHDERHDEILIRLLAQEFDQEPDREDEWTQALEREGLADCATCRERLAEIRALGDQLDRAAAWETEAVERGVAAAEPEGDDDVLVDEVFGRLAGPSPAPDRARFGARRLLLAAATLLGLLLAGWWLRGAGNREPLDTTPMHGRAVFDLEHDGFTRFTWKAELPPGGTFSIRIYPASSAGLDPDEAVDRLDEWQETEWHPEPNRSQSWPDEILWQVEAREADGRSIGSATSSASRS